MRLRRCPLLLALVLGVIPAACSSWRTPVARAPVPVAGPKPLPAKPDPVGDARTLLALTHQGEMTELLLLREVQWAVSQLHERDPRIPPDELRLIGLTIMRDLSQEVMKPGGLLDQEAALYAHYYTDAELRDMITFFRRPAGQSMLLESPQIELETEGLQRRWAAALEARIFKDVRARVTRAGYPDLPGR